MKDDLFLLGVKDAISKLKRNGVDTSAYYLITSPEQYEKIDKRQAWRMIKEAGMRGVILQTTVEQGEGYISATRGM